MLSTAIVRPPQALCCLRCNLVPRSAFEGGHGAVWDALGVRGTKQTAKARGPLVVVSAVAPATPGAREERIIERELSDEATSSYLSYAMSVIVGRALPDVRDGLKPVHRRILFAMDDLGLDAGKPFRKCARVVGEVLGKYHPHGDQAVYDSMVRMAQPFAMAEVLVDGHGNFGSVDDDPAAAMRYTECRLKPLASDLLLADLDPAVVPFVPNFDESTTEPSVLPARVPQLLLNGSQGIAVGMATKIPPHNMAEVVAGLKAVIDDPDISLAELMAHIPAPDFPTGGTLIGADGGIERAYATGRGSMVLRAKYHIERDEKRGKETIVITELPYQVYKAALIADIAALVEKDVVSGVSDVRDESDRRGMRITLELKRSAAADVVVNNLLAHSRLQIQFSANMVALVDGAPVTLSLLQMLQRFVDFRYGVIVKRAEKRLGDKRARFHLVQGYLKAVDNLDAVVAAIRSAPDAAAAKTALQGGWELTSEQADGVLNLSLRRLTSLAIDELRDESAALAAEIVDLEALIADRGRIMKLMKSEADALVKSYGRPRRTVIADDSVSSMMDVEDLIPDEPVVIVFSAGGYIKSMKDKTFTAQRRGGVGKSGTRLKPDDAVERVLTVTTHDTLVLVTATGEAYKLAAHAVPERHRTAVGAPLAELLPGLPRGAQVAAILPLRTFDDGRSLLMLSRGGLVKRVRLPLLKKMRQGMRVLQTRGDDRVCFAATCSDEQYVLTASSSGRAALFPAAEVRESGRGAVGVKAMRVAAGEHVVGGAIVDAADRDGTKEGGPWLLLASSKGLGKRVKLSDIAVHRRGSKGVTCIKLDEGSALASVSVVSVSGGDAGSECLVTTSTGLISRIKLDNIPVLGRATKGPILVRMSDGGSLVSLTPCQYGQESGSDAEADAGEPGATTTLPPHNGGASRLQSSTDL